MTFDLAAIYREHHRLIWWVVRSCRIPEPAVEDVVQDVFVAVDRRRHRLPPGDIRPWLVGIARGVSYSHHRGRVRRGLRDAEWLQSHPVESPAVDRTYDAKRQLNAMFSQLDELDPTQREAFVLIELHGLDPMDVARLRGVTSALVKADPFSLSRSDP